jgi:hypothetical protein
MYKAHADAHCLLFMTHRKKQCSLMHKCMLATYGCYDALHTMHDICQAITKPFSSIAELAFTPGKQE